MKINSTRYLPHACALLFSFFVLQGSAAAQVTVYSDINYSGSSQTFQNDVPNFMDAGFNDVISSIRVPSGETWQFCQEVNYQGSCQTLRGSIADLRRINWNDRISSMRRVRGGLFGNRDDYSDNRYGEGITVFANPNFGGRRASFNGDVPDLRQYGMNDQVTSIEVPRGETWEICVDIDYQGACQTVRGSVSDLRDMGWNDRISSMRRVSGANYRNRRYGSTGTSGSYNEDGLVFYNQPNFRGASQFVANGSSVGLNAYRGSVQVRGGGVWRVCDNNGDCATIDRDVSNVGDLGLNGRITSVREVNNSGRRFPFGR
jgi:hypothetical protein